MEEPGQKFVKPVSCQRFSYRSEKCWSEYNLYMAFKKFFIGVSTHFTSFSVPKQNMTTCVIFQVEPLFKKILGVCIGEKTFCESKGPPSIVQLTFGSNMLCVRNVFTTSGQPKSCSLVFGLLLLEIRSGITMKGRSCRFTATEA